MKNYWRAVNEVIRRSDILIQVLDARFPEETQNKEVELKVLNSGKTLINVVNKSDLAGDKNFPNSYVVLSSRSRRGLRSLRERIMIEAKRLDKSLVFVGVLGYPNTGKSSLINTLKGRSSARTSPKSGFTKGMQKVKISDKIFMYDTPGVIPFGEDDEEKHVLMGAMNPEDAEFPEDAAEVVINNFKDKIKKKYGCDSLEELAQKWNLKEKGGGLNLKLASIRLLREWQRGELSNIY